MMTSSMLTSLISVKRCFHYRGTVAQKCLAVGQGVKMLGQKNEGGEGNEPASLRVKLPIRPRLSPRILRFCHKIDVHAQTQTHTLVHTLNGHGNILLRFHIERNIVKI